jgi:hypothetical protein
MNLNPVVWALDIIADSMNPLKNPPGKYSYAAAIVIMDITVFVCKITRRKK